LKELFIGIKWQRGVIALFVDVKTYMDIARNIAALFFMV
jgi:hypothetical protein